MMIRPGSAAPCGAADDGRHRAAIATRGDGQPCRRGSLGFRGRVWRNERPGLRPGRLITMRVEAGGLEPPTSTVRL